MDDDAVNTLGTEERDALIATGGFCAPIAGDFYRPVRDALPTFTAERGAITYAKPPEGGWPPYVAPKVTRRQRWAKRIEARKSRTGDWLVALGGRLGGTCTADHDDWF